MPFFENILLFYNDQFSGIKSEVIQLVRKNQAKLKIIDVFDNLDQYYELLPPSISIDELKELIISERRQEIIGHFEAYPDIKGQMTVIFKFGNTVVEIIKEVIRGKHDLLIKAASGKQTFTDRLFGNIAVKLLRKCPCPVLIVKPSENASFQKILAPVDVETIGKETTKTDEHGDFIYRKVMDISIAMARMENSHLDIFHCWFLPGETLLASGRTRIDPDNLDHMRMLAEKIHTRKINTLVGEYDLSDIRHSVILLKGEAGEMIVDYSDKNGIDLIVMGTIGRSGLSGLLIGSTAEKVIERANCSVLTIKPDNFKSPVTV
ncbi:MAG: universal stress protein [Desulfobacterales bacterium]|jgi:nucleotide-binding universal stress UspA family protein